MKRIQKILIVLATLFSAACSHNAQVSGIIGEMAFSTQACVPQEKIINIRNDDTQNPQRVMGVYFEMGTNPKNYFKIPSVDVGGTSYAASSNLAQEVIIPAGGVMAVHIVYNPREVTTHRGEDVSYVDLFLNGPKLGILQVRVKGDSPTAADGCKPLGKGQNFTIDKTTVIVSHKDINGGQPLEITADSTDKKFSFSADSTSGKAKMDDTGFPPITIALPPDIAASAGIPTLTITLVSDSYEGTFQDGDLEFEHLNLMAVIIPVNDVKLTTKNASATGTNGSLSKDGKKLDGGKMTLVAAVKVPDDTHFDSIKEGVLGLVIEMTQAQ